jgi:hypothetical protein
MSREAAAEILGVVLRHSAEQDEVLARVRSMCSEHEFRGFQQAIGKTMGAMLLEVINPIVSTYPELMPPEMKRPS